MKAKHPCRDQEIPTYENAEILNPFHRDCSHLVNFRPDGSLTAQDQNQSAEGSSYLISEIALPPDLLEQPSFVPSRF
jgi:hypothetical protein